MVKNKPIKEYTIFDALGRLINSLPKIASLVIGFTAFAYVIGWLQAKTYFTQFGASWLLSELSTISILGFSWFPIVLLIFFCYLTTLDLSEGRQRAERNIFFVLRYGKIILVLLIIIQILLEMFKIKLVMAGFAYFFAITMILYASSAYGYLIISFQDPKFKWNLSTTYITFTILFCGFYLVPSNLGKSDAYRKMDINNSNLPIIKIHNKEEEFRLLHNNGDRYYAILIPFKGKYPEIFIIDDSEIISIIGSNSRSKIENQQ